MTYSSDDLSHLSTIQKKELLVRLLSDMEELAFPLSLAQQRLWFLDRLYPGNPVYNVPFGLLLKGGLNREALELSVCDLVVRHQTLRTKFATKDSQPVQVVEAGSTIDIPFIDLTGISISERYAKAYSIAIEQARLSFDLSVAPLLRFTLIRLTIEEHLLLCVMHHIVCDAWSVEILIRDLAVLYTQYSSGAQASLPRLAVQYGDYAQWQREWFTSERHGEQVRYWRQKLLGAPLFLNLPTDHIRPLEQSHEGASQVVSVSQALIDGLADCGRSQRATLFMVMLAALQTLFHCYTGAEDILVGVPVSSRNRVELEELIGCFVNTSVLRGDLSGNPRFCDLLLRVRGTVLDAFANAELPFERLVECLKPERTLSYNPVVQVMLSVVRVKKLPDFGKLSARPYPFNSQTSPFDISMQFIEDADDRWWLQITYATSLFGATRIAKMLDDYLAILKLVAAQPELRVSALALLLHPEAGTAIRDGQIPSNQKKEPVAWQLERAHFHSANMTGPQDALQRILMRIWERVLGCTDIGIRDNFFDLGGHSLLAAHLISEVEKAVGRRIPLSALFRDSTIESLADVIRGDRAWNPEELLMELNPGTRGHSLFAIVQPGGDALGYALLARHMGPEQPFYKVQGSASAHREGFLSREELHALAQEYVAAIQSIHPQGPYFLVAMCYGVHIAESVVRELESHGHEVGFLAIIDTFVLEHSRIRWLTHLRSFHHGRHNVSQLPLSAQVSHYKQVLKKRIRHLLFGKMESERLWIDAFWPGKEFQIKQFRAPVLLFRIAKQPFYTMRDPQMGWGGRTLSGVKISTLNDAEHREMLREPAVKVIAAQLKTSLRYVDKVDFSSARAEEAEPISQ
jgi:thioesterase domain-containing protein/acyl carrier protein